MTETRKKPYRWWCRNRYVRRTAMVIYFSLLFPVSIVIYAVAWALEGARLQTNKFREMWEECK